MDMLWRQQSFLNSKSCEKFEPEIWRCRAHGKRLVATTASSTAILSRKMKEIISKKQTRKVLLILFGAITAFHILVITGLIPYDIVWGGRLESVEAMLKFEAISLTINLIILLVLFLDSKNRIRPARRYFFKFWHISMACLFTLNTVGNLLSNNQFEVMVFTPLTLVIALLSIRMAVDWCFLDDLHQPQLSVFFLVLSAAVLVVSGI